MAPKIRTICCDGKDALDPDAMTPFDRYRAERNDPYGGFYAPRPNWGARLAIAVPLTVAVVLVLSLALSAVHPGAKRSRGFGPVASVGYQSLLIPSAGAAPTFQAGSSSASGQRVVMGANVPTVTHAAKAHSATRKTTATGGHRSYRTDANGYRLAPAADAALVPSKTIVAHLEHTTKGYPSATAFQSNRKVPGAWYGYPSILPVIESTRDRLHVKLAQRPLESTSWIKRGAAVLSKNHWAIVIDLSQHWLYVFRHGIQQSSFPVGIGAPGTPTPTGNFFLAFKAPPNGPGYGPVMLETSGHSRVIARFDGGDDAIIAIHGPVGSDSRIGDRGAAISNGCIRMHTWDLRQVRHVRNGAPVIITP
jgi:lipoprotein-anchoring transpeptidase ErfK/SrfK